MPWSVSRSVAAVLGIGLGLVACGTTGDGETVAADPATIETGEALYSENCAECHGTDLRGTDQGPSFLSPIYEPGHHGDGAFLVAVQSGVQPHHWDFGAMPPVEGLSPGDVEAIVAFVRDRQQTEGFEP